MAWIDPPAFGGTDAGDVARRLRTAGLVAYRCFPAVHRTEMFLPSRLGRLAGRAGPPPDYAGIETPVAEAAAREAIWFHHALLLGDVPLVTEIAEVLGSLRLTMPALV